MAATRADHANGTCEGCGGPCAVFGCRHCPACYGGIFDEEGRPLLPGDPADPFRAVNAEADAYILDTKMPPNVAAEIELIAHRRAQENREYKMYVCDEARDPLAAWPIIDGPLRGEVMAWPSDFFYAAELLPPAVRPQEAPPRRDDGMHRTEYRLRAVPQGGFVWSCATHD